MIQILLLVVIVSLLDSIYLYLMQKHTTIYTIPQPASMIQLVYSYIIWFTIAISIYFLIVSRPDFSFATILKTAPLLGFAIFGIYGISNVLSLADKWSWNIVGIDILRGIILVTISTIIISFFRKI